MHVGFSFLFGWWSRAAEGQHRRGYLLVAGNHKTQRIGMGMFSVGRCVYGYLWAGSELRVFFWCKLTFTSGSLSYDVFWFSSNLI